jgi:hypothetical protein
MTNATPDLAIWSTAVNSALLGTDRAPLTPPPLGGALGAAFGALVRPESDAASNLLRVAAAAGAYQRCGRTPGRTQEVPPSQSPPDDRPTCTPAAAALLRRILQGEHESLLRTWLALATRHDVRAPADSLPAMLDRASKDPKLRALVRATGGTRATWLAALNEDWAFAISGDSPDALATIWETGAGMARIEALQRLRQIDPERARTLLEASWAQEDPNNRVFFLAVLAFRLSPTDEPFLERALDDRRKEVRQQAAGLLVRLPSSALAARMLDRARQVVTLGTSAILQRPRIDVTPPDEADDSMVRDGINPKPTAGTGIGEKAWMLAQIIGAVPPSTWTAASSIEPARLIRAAEDHEWREALVAGWLTATERFHDTTWARALWDNESVARIEPKWGAPPLEHVFTRAASADVVDAELRREVDARQDALRGAHRVAVAFLRWPNDWSDPLARAVAKRLKSYAGDDRVSFTSEFGMRALLERCAHAAPVSAADAFLDGWPEQSEVWSTWASAVDTLRSVLRFRKDLHLAFNEESLA